MSEKDIGIQAAELYKDYKDNLDDPDSTAQNLDQAREFAIENMDALKDDAMKDAIEAGKRIIGPAEGMAVNVNVIHQNVEVEGDSYNKKVDFLVAAMEPQNQESVDSEQARLIGAVGGAREAEAVNIWDILRRSEQSKVADELKEILSGRVDDIPKTPEERDAFDKVVAKLSIVRLGVHTIPGADEFRDRGNKYLTFPADLKGDVDKGLYDLIDTDTLEDPANLTKAELTIKALLLDGLQQFYANEYANSALQDAIKLLEVYTRDVPNFRPLKAGYEYVQLHAVAIAGALRADDTSKPNWEYAKPERRPIRKEIWESLHGLSAVKAHVFLRRNDFDLPDEAE